MPEQHAKYSPSSFNYRAQCAAWESRNETSEASEEGTLLHAAMETGYTEALTPEQKEQVDKCFRFLVNLEGPAATVHKELRLEIRAGRHETWGTADRVILSNGVATLVDFKFGRLAVPPVPENLQAMAYAVGVLQRFEDVPEVRVYFLSPRRDEVSYGVFARDRLKDYEKRLADLLNRVKAKNPERTPCKACEYCAAIADCPAVTKDISRLGAQAGIELPADLDVESMTPQVLGEFALPFARIAEQWAKRVKDRAKELLQAGEEIPGYKLGERSARQTVDGTVNDVWSVVDSTGLLSLELFLPACSVSVSQLRAAVRKAAPRGGKDEAEALLMRKLRVAGLLPEEPPKEYVLQRA